MLCVRYVKMQHTSWQKNESDDQKINVNITEKVAIYNVNHTCGSEQYETYWTNVCIVDRQLCSRIFVILYNCILVGKMIRPISTSLTKINFPKILGHVIHSQNMELIDHDSVVHRTVLLGPKALTPQKPNAEWSWSKTYNIPYRHGYTIIRENYVIIT